MSTVSASISSPLPAVLPRRRSTLPTALLERVSDLATTDRQGLLELLDLVSAADRRVLTLRFVYRLRGRELAQELGISHGAARTRLSRALSRLATAYHRADRFAGGRVWQRRASDARYEWLA